MIARLICWLREHDDVKAFDHAKGIVYVACQRCGRTSDGYTWHVTKERHD